jgi:hypothetical protein
MLGRLLSRRDEWRHRLPIVIPALAAIHSPPASLSHKSSPNTIGTARQDTATGSYSPHLILKMTKQTFACSVSSGGTKLFGRETSDVRSADKPGFGGNGTEHFNVFVGEPFRSVC